MTEGAAGAGRGGAGRGGAGRGGTRQDAADTDRLLGCAARIADLRYVPAGSGTTGVPWVTCLQGRWEDA